MKDSTYSLRLWRMANYVKGGVLLDKGKIDEAIFVLKKVVKSYEDKESYSFALHESYLKLGEAYLQKDDVEMAQNYLLRSLKGQTMYDIPKGIASVNNQLALVYKRQGKYETAILKATQALQNGQKIKSKEIIKQASETLANLYDLSGDIEKAYFYQTMSIAARDSLKNFEKAVRFLEVQQVFEKELQGMRIKELEQENNLQKLTNQRQLLLFVGLILITLFLIVSTIIFYRLYRSNERKRFKIEIQKDKLSESLRERELLMEELQHRTKNNFLMIKGLLRYHGENLENSQLKAVLNDSKNRVNAISLLHEHLYSERDIPGKIAIKPYLENLTHSLTTSIPDHVSLQVRRKIVDTPVDINKIVPLGLILNEAFTNAVKHAFIGHEKSSQYISVEFMPLEDEGHCLLIVSDNGVGYNQEKYLSKKNNGIELMKGLAQQIRGVLDIQFERKVGTKVLLKFPKTHKIHK